MCAAMLTLQAIIVGLAVPVLISIEDVEPSLALPLGLGLALVPIFTFVLILALILVGRQGRLVIGAAPLRGHGAGDRSTHSSRAAVA